MISPLQSPDSRDRPPGVIGVAALLLCVGVVSLSFAALVAVGAAPLSAGAFLLEGGLEQLGPIAFVLYACIAVLLAAGLWKRKNWSRRLTLLLSAAGIAIAVPAISSAVVDGRTWAIAREGMQIIVRVVVLYSLSQEPVRDWFS